MCFWFDKSRPKIQAKPQNQMFASDFTMSSFISKHALSIFSNVDFPAD